MEKIGRYHIIKELGRGGMAVVYRAQDPNLNNRDVAIKVISTYLSADSDFRARFSREAQAIATLDHPAIVPLYDFGEEQDQPYIVMRHMSGGSLQDRLKANGAMSWSDTISHLSRIAEALDHAHREGVVHRDIKPANLLFDQFDNLYLADFGIVKLMRNNQTAATQGSLGTPQYMAPEVWDGAKASAQTDVYAIGCVAYEMLTGDVLFGGDSQSEIITKHLVKGPELPIQWPSNLPPNLNRIFEKVLAKAPAERYQSVGEFVMALQLTNEATMVGSMSAPTLIETPASMQTLVEPTAPTATPIQPIAAQPQPVATPAETSEPSLPPITDAAPAPKRSKRGVIIGALLGLMLCIGVVVVGLGVSAWRSGVLDQFMGRDDAVAVEVPTEAPEALTTPTDEPAEEPTAAPDPTDEPTSEPEAPTEVPTAVVSEQAVPLGEYATQSMAELLPEFPIGEYEFGGVTFFLDDPGKVSTQTQSTPDEEVDHGLAPETISIPIAPVKGAENVYVLINVGFGVGFEDKEVGAIQLQFEDGRDYTIPLVMNVNIREWGVVQPFRSPDLQEVYRGPNRFGDDSVVDMLTIPVPPDYKDTLLVAVVLMDKSQELLSSPDPGIFIAGLTVEGESP